MWLCSEITDPLAYGELATERQRELLRAWIMGEWRRRYPVGSRMEGHLSTCPDVQIEFDAFDGDYGCDCPSPCQYVRCEAELSCPHGVEREFDFGEFGLLAELLQDLESKAGWHREQRGEFRIFVGTLPESRSVLSMWVIYEDPADYPGQYVARMHQVGAGTVAVNPEPVIVAPSLQEVRAVVPEGKVRLDPQPGEDPKIKEVWL